MSENKTLSGNLRRMGFYVCPQCGNVIQSMAPGSFSCCGQPLQKLEAKDGSQQIRVEVLDGEYYVTMDHPMTKENFLSFLALVTSDRVYFQKLYPEQSAQARFPVRTMGTLYAYSPQEGLLSRRV